MKKVSSQNKHLIKKSLSLFQKYDSCLQYGFSYRFRLWVYRFFKFEEFANRQVLWDEYDKKFFWLVAAKIDTLKGYYETKDYFFSKYKITDL